MPCFKLGIRFGDPTIVKRFYKSGKWGFYLSVLEEGEIETGDEIFVADRLSDRIGDPGAQFRACSISVFREGAFEPSFSADTRSFSAFLR